MTRSGHRWWPEWARNGQKFDHTGGYYKTGPELFLFFSFFAKFYSNQFNVETSLALIKRTTNHDLITTKTKKQNKKTKQGLLEESRQKPHLAKPTSDCSKSVETNLFVVKTFCFLSELWFVRRVWSHQNLMRNYSNMASSLPAFQYLLAMPASGKQISISTRPSSLQTRAQGCRDEGKSI